MHELICILFSYIYIYIYFGESNKQQGLGFLNARAFEELLAHLIRGT